MNVLDEFEEYLKKGSIYFFGAGAVAKQCAIFCSKKNIKIEGFVVSSMANNPPQIDKEPVRTLEGWENIGVKAEQMNVIVALSNRTVENLDTFFLKSLFKSVFFIPATLYEKLKIIELVDQYELIQSTYRIDCEYPRTEIRLGVLIEIRTGLPMFRIALTEGIKLIDSLVRNATREKFEKSFGELRRLPYVENSILSMETVKKEKVEIYIATSHLDRRSVGTLNSKGYIPIQCGAALTKIRKGFITDDTGDSISKKNKDYCECTGLYWIWKNTSGQDYIGLCHYCRRMVLDDKSIRYLKNNDIDVVVTMPQFERLTIRETFRRYLLEKDWILLKQKVIEYDNNYRECFEKYENGHFYFPCNVNLWKRKWFNQYCTFAFEVVESIEKYYTERNIVREDRFAGYLFEQLPSLFIMFHRTQLKIVCSEIEWIE